MLEAKLTPCASLLYQWIVARVPLETKLKVDLQDFQAWTGEYRERSYSDREILDALRQLKTLELIGVSKTEVTVEAKPVEDESFNIHPTAQLFLNENDRSEETNRWLLLAKIVFSSLALSITTVVLGLAIAQTQPQVFNMSNSWSVLGEK
ncbi:MAG: hypothetical protein KME17_01010 [Cyanosarcina radialis HA8281-LM2]|jgi:hypothetical protein|nr:hypothetical protein [Cyanosarcina radialis HA8281-LM2]